MATKKKVEQFRYVAVRLDVDTMKIMREIGKRSGVDTAQVCAVLLALHVAQVKK